MLAERADREGPVRFSEFMETALYHPTAGFYAVGNGAGRSNDFLTSPEVGPLFAEVLAQALDTWWEELDHPDPFVVVEAGAGVGTLAAAILAADPECLYALRYITVERSETLRAQQYDRLKVHDISEWDQELGAGPLVFRSADLPHFRFTGVILANELLDNLAFDLVEFARGRWNQVCFAPASETGEALVAMRPDDPAQAYLKSLPRVPSGSRLPIQSAAQEWVRSALGHLEQGRLVTFDYGSDARHLLERPQAKWLRTYRNHRPGDSPFTLPGSQDITVDVDGDQMALVAPLAANRSQEEFLNEHGLRDLVTEAREVWHGQAKIGDLSAVRARARVQESHALTDPTGLGAHRVLEWVVGAERDEEASE